MIKFYLLFGIYLTTVYSSKNSDKDIFDEIHHEEVLNRIKRLNQPNTTTPFTSPPTSIPPMNITANRSATYIITSFNSLVTTTQSSSQMNSTVTYSVPATTSSISLYNPDTCTNSSYIRLWNNTCVTKYDAQIIAAGVLRTGLTNSTETIDAIALYISSITNSTTLSNTTNTLSVDEIDNLVDALCNLNVTINSNTSFVMVQQPIQGNNRIILGASYKRGIGGEVVDTTNIDNITNSFISAAAIVSVASLNGVVSLNLLIIDQPTGYENADTKTNKTLASSVIVAYLRRNSSTYNSVIISLYFNPVTEYKRSGKGRYLCSFYDVNSSEWDEAGCTDAHYNKEYTRYECNCSHLTSFALIWLPESLSSTNGTQALQAQDIASLIFQSISIICFLIIIIHATCVRFVNPLMRIQTLKLIPLISTASTTILFIFYIALGMTVYTQTSSTTETECFLSSKILMFITYYLLIYMFCVKTSAGYFYYLRFVRLFPQPSHRQLLLMLFISFFLSTVCVAIAIGLNTNPSYNIIQSYPYRLCWFTRDVMYYFLTIPIGIFLFLNIITITLVSRSIITHALNARTRERTNERMKRCAIVLLSSCVTQGIGWLCGPFISFINPLAGNILGWFFIIVNGLEGLWSIVLYLLIRAQRIDEQKHTSAAVKLSKSLGLSSNNEKKIIEKKDDNKRHDERTIDKSGRKVRLYSFIDLRKRDTDPPGNDYYEREFNQ